MNIPMESVKVLRDLMDNTGAKELARIVRIDRTTLYNVLKGRAAPITIRKLEPVMKIIGIANMDLISTTSTD